MRRMPLASVWPERDRHLGDAMTVQTCFDDHLRGEFHSSAPLAKALIHAFGEPSQPAVNIVNRRLEPPPHQKRKQRVPNPSMRKRHRAELDRPAARSQPASLDEVVTFAQFFNEFRQL